MSAYQNDIKAVAALKEAAGSSWSAINPESVARMRAQNRFKTGLEIAQYTADIMRKDMAEYDADSSKYTQSLGCWHGFIGQQKLIAIKKHLGTTNKRYLYLSGWMVAALRSDFGPLPDQSMHEKTAVSDLIEELYTFLRQADSRELDLLFTALDAARAAGDNAKAAEIQNQIDNYETHIVPIIADIDAGFGNPEATYLLAKRMIEAGACCIQIENQVSDEKQCGHQDGKVTVPHADFLAKIAAVRYAFLELGIDNGVIVARTDSLGAGLTKQIAVTKEPGDLGDLYNSFLDCEEVAASDDDRDVVLSSGWGAANVSLLLYVVMLLVCLRMLNATLTLPGIAGIILSMGMAVDANVLIFERFKEEHRAGKTLRASMDAGFSRAFVTIFDSNVTTLFASVILFFFGSGPIKGFAVTLSLGIVLSMFTAITVTKILLKMLMNASLFKSGKAYGA